MTWRRTAANPITWQQLLSAGVFALFVIAIEMLFGWATLLEPWSKLQPLTVLGVALALFSTYVARALRLYRYFDNELDFLTCQKLLLQHNLWTVLLPARTGEAAFPVLMHRYFQVLPRQSIPVLLWFRILDLHSLVLVFACAWLWNSRPQLAPVFAVTWIGLLFAALRARHLLSSLLAGRPGKLAAKCRELLEEDPRSLVRLAESWAWTAVCWITKLVLFALILGTFTSLNFLPSLAGALGGEVSSSLPIHGVGGFGTYHTGVATALVPIGVNLETALRGGVNLHLVVLGGALISGLLAYAIPTASVERKERTA